MHIDVTLPRLLDGTKAYLHAVIDDFLRRILARKVAARLEPANTFALLADVAQELRSLRGVGLASVVSDVCSNSGVENING